MTQECSILPIGEAYQAISSLDAERLVALCDPNVQFESRITAVEENVYGGHDGARRFIANLAEAFERVEVQSSDIVGDKNRAAMTNSFRAWGRGSGVEVEKPFFIAARGRKGKLLWWGMFDSRAEALEAVSLAE